MDNMIHLLQIITFLFGAKELWNSLEYHKQQKEKWAIVSFCMGLFSCICALISMTGIL